MSIFKYLARQGIALRDHGNETDNFSELATMRANVFENCKCECHGQKA